MFLDLVEVSVRAEARRDLNKVEAVVVADADPVEGDAEEVAAACGVLVNFNEVVVVVVDRDPIQRGTNGVVVHNTVMVEVEIVLLVDETIHGLRSLADEHQHADIRRLKLERWHGDAPRVP